MKNRKLHIFSSETTFGLRDERAHSVKPELT